jgi:hypothetical protein
MKNDNKIGLIISIIIALALMYLLSGCQKEEIPQCNCGKIKDSTYCLTKKETW